MRRGFDPPTSTLQAPGGNRLAHLRYLCSFPVNLADSVSKLVTSRRPRRRLPALSERQNMPRYFGTGKESSALCSRMERSFDISSADACWICLCSTPPSVGGQLNRCTSKEDRYRGGCGAPHICRLAGCGKRKTAARPEKPRGRRCEGRLR